MRHIKVISFDAEGTLVTPDFTDSVWHKAIPSLYAEKKGMDSTQANEVVTKEYEEIGEQRLEWYDINYWFRYFQLGSPETMIQSCMDKLQYYPEVIEVLSSLSKQYKLVIASGTPMELLYPMLQDMEPYLTRIFSAPSHYRQLKTPEFYRELCKAMNTQPEQVVHVGDNWQFDFLNPRQIGINACYLDRAGKDHQESISNLSELKSYLPG